jgi:hypothetical protein
VIAHGWVRHTSMTMRPRVTNTTLIQMVAGSASALFLTAASPQSRFSWYSQARCAGLVPNNSFKPKPLRGSA